MIDYYLDPTTHDVVINNFTLAVTKDKADLITQRIKIKLMWFMGEWFLDENYGIPYLQEVFIKGVDLNTLDDIFRQAIADEDGVLDLVEYSSEFNSTTRSLTIKSKIRVDSGEIIGLSFNL